MIKEIFFLILAYILGSFPSGYIFTKIFTKKNILEIGWRKTSGSNVFKNVGFLPGILTAFFDILKGWLAVFLSQKFNLSLEIQAFCGFLAVTGHNWSIFLKGAGGRGVATFLGAFLAFDSFLPLILILFVLPIIILWDTSIATIFFLIMSIFYIKNELLIFSIFSCMIIFLKRLSPFKEIFFKKPKLIFARLLFDDDVFHEEPRIKKIINRLTKRKI